MRGIEHGRYVDMVVEPPPPHYCRPPSIDDMKADGLIEGTTWECGDCLKLLISYDFDPGSDVHHGSVSWKEVRYTEDEPAGRVSRLFDRYERSILFWTIWGAGAVTGSLWVQFVGWPL